MAIEIWHHGPRLRSWLLCALVWVAVLRSVVAVSPSALIGALVAGCSDCAELDADRRASQMGPSMAIGETDDPVGADGCISTEQAQDDDLFVRHDPGAGAGALARAPDERSPDNLHLRVVSQRLDRPPRA
jgi:hypothetical protein